MSFSDFFFIKWFEPESCLLTDDFGPVAPLVDPFFVLLLVLCREDEFLKEAPLEEHYSS